LSQRLVDGAKADAWSRRAGRIAASTTRCRLDINAELAGFGPLRVRDTLFWTRATEFIR
jgi:hypothetical protein